MEAHLKNFLIILFELSFFRPFFTALFSMRELRLLRFNIAAVFAFKGLVLAIMRDTFSFEFFQLVKLEVGDFFLALSEVL